MKFHESISVVVPVYNEATLVENAISRINDFLRTSFADFEIIIVESGSRDGTDKLCDKLSKRFKRVKIIHEGSKKGYGSALKKGFRVARWDLIWPITVDLPFPPESIFTALPLLSEYECILSYRTRDNRGNVRKFQSAVFNFLIKKLLGVRVKHVNSAFKLYKRGVIKNLNLKSDGWLLDAEIIYRLKQQKIKFTEIGTPLVDRKYGKSSVNLLTPFSLIIELLNFASNKDK